jgi:hypothetical protein
MSDSIPGRMGPVKVAEAVRRRRDRTRGTPVFAPRSAHDVRLGERIGTESDKAHTRPE